MRVIKTRRSRRCVEVRLGRQPAPDSACIPKITGPHPHRITVASPIDLQRRLNQRASRSRRCPAAPASVDPGLTVMPSAAGVGMSRTRACPGATVGALHVNASIGIVTLATTDPRTAEDILRDADIAMYEAKTAGHHRHTSQRTWPPHAINWKPNSDPQHRNRSGVVRYSRSRQHRAAINHSDGAILTTLLVAQLVCSAE